VRRLLITTPVLATFGGVTAITIVAALTNSNCAAVTSGAADQPSRAAVREIPTWLLPIYEQVGSQYGIPWEVLAGIGTEECGQARISDPSCTLQPGETGPGTANDAGASGLMQIGVGGAAGDAYDQLRHYLPNPSLGPHDPTTAIQLAALVLIKDKGAPTGQPIDAYLPYARAYNGTGPAAEAYANRVIADATRYDGGSSAGGSSTCAEAATLPGALTLTPGQTAQIIPATGDATAPANAPVQVKEAIAAGNAIHTKPYPEPDVHYGTLARPWPAYDCSGSVSYVLYEAGLLSSTPLVSGQLEHWGASGPGKWITVYANAGHTWIVVAGIAFDTAGYGGPSIPAGSGPRWRAIPTANLGDEQRYAVRHPAGL
jgi:hypothetical protein